MAGTTSKAVSRAKKAIHKVVARQRRKRAMAKAGRALKTAGKAAAAVGLVAGAAFAARSMAKRKGVKVRAFKKVVKKAARGRGR